MGASLRVRRSARGCGGQRTARPTRILESGHPILRSLIERVWTARRARLQFAAVRAGKVRGDTGIWAVSSFRTESAGPDSAPFPDGA